MKALLRWIFSDVFPKNPLPLSKRFCSLPLYAPSAMRCSRATCAWVLCPGTHVPFNAIHHSSIYIDQWRWNWCRQDCQHNGTHYLSCSLSKNSWISADIMNFISINTVKHNFKVICSTYLHMYFNHTTLMRQSLKTFYLEDPRFPTKCAPKKSALLTEVLKQPLLNILFNQIRSFLSLFFIWSNI